MLGLLLCLLGTDAARAHPISVTQAFVYVTREKVTAKVEVFAEDLFLFHNLKPNDRDFLEPDMIRKGIEQHRQFLLDRFAIRDVRGDRLTGKVTAVKTSDMQPEGLPLSDLMANKLTFELEYALSQPPEFLTFSQHFVDDRLLAPAEMQLHVKQENAGTPYQEVLYPNMPQTVRFSWTNPPLAPDASQEAWKTWYEQQKEETLGITSYSTVYSFLYIDDYEVRHEILIPLGTLEASLPIARADDAFLEVAEQDAARRQIEAFFTAGNPVEIDGLRVQPVVQRLDFYGLDFKDFARPAERRRVSMANARVGIILSYSTKGAPATVQVTWDRYNQFIWTVNMIVYAYDATARATLSRVGQQNTYRWQNPGREPPPPLAQVDVLLPPRPRLSLPVLSLTCLSLFPVMILLMWWRAAAVRSYFFGTALVAVCAAAVWPFGRWELPHPWAPVPELSAEQVRAVFATLHKNIYRAFDYRDESDVYDALAKSVDGPLLRDLYLKIRRGLEMREQGGAVSRVREVHIVAGEKVPFSAPPGADSRSFRYCCRWTVAGTVEHWGHIHARTNEYEALFTVEPRHNAWKITHLQVMSEKRLKFETSLRGL